MSCAMPQSAWWVQGKVIVFTLGSTWEKQQNSQEVQKNTFTCQLWNIPME